MCANGVAFLALAAESGLKRQHFTRLIAAAIKVSMAKEGVQVSPEALEQSIVSILPDPKLLPELLD
jgi:hypothetical protein